MTLSDRATMTMWACIACAQPWFVAGSKWGWVWASFAAVAWLAAKLAENIDSQTDFVQRAFRWLSGAR